MTKHSILTSIIWSLILLGASLFVIFGFNGLPYEYIGRQGFHTTEEAGIFRAELTEEADNVGASISIDSSTRAGITQVNYIAHMPTHEAFGYGKQVLSLSLARTFQVFFTMVYAIICFSIWGDLKKKKEAK